MSLVKLVIYSVILVFFINSLIASTDIQAFRVTKVPAFLKELSRFRFHFFTIWNFILQVIFMIIAITDETTKLIHLSTIQKRIEKVRHFFFSALVFPSSLVVQSVFWGLWHIDRELIFPKAIDEFYPSWLNHTLHTYIGIPLVLEILFQLGNDRYRVSRIKAGMVMTVYSTFYQALYLSVYFQYGVWLYPIYRYLDWPQRIAFILFQYLLLIAYQQIGITLLNRGKVNETKAKLK